MRSLTKTFTSPPAREERKKAKGLNNEVARVDVRDVDLTGRNRVSISSSGSGVPVIHYAGPRLRFGPIQVSSKKVSGTPLED